MKTTIEIDVTVIGQVHDPDHVSLSVVGITSPEGRQANILNYLDTDTFDILCEQLCEELATEEEIRREDAEEARGEAQREAAMERKMDL